jgi:hypothetical protein
MTKPRAKERLFRKGFQGEIWPDNLTRHLARTGQCEKWRTFAYSIGFSSPPNAAFGWNPFRDRLWLCVWKMEVANFADFDQRVQSSGANRQLLWDLLADLLCHQDVVRVWPEELLIILLVANSTVPVDRGYLVGTLGLSDRVSDFLLSACTQRGAALTPR